MNLGIFYRLLFSLILLFVVSASFMAYTLINEAKKSVEASRLHQANTMVKALAEGSLDALAVNDYELIERWLKASNSIDDFAYAYLSKPDGLIISHTEPEMVARYADVLGELNKPISRDIIYQNRQIKEVVSAAYLGNRHMANAHIAYYLDSAAWNSEKVVARLLGLLVVALLALSLFTFVILRWALKPVEVLSVAIQGIATDKDYSVRVVKQRNDEVGVLVSSFNNMLEQIQLRDSELIKQKDAAESSANEARVYAHEVALTNNELESEITERLNVENKLRELSNTLEQRVKDRTIKLEELNKIISEVSRNAGMAEVASGILHNVGNVLNSVNVSSSVIRDQIRKSSLQNLSKIVVMLEQHKDQLCEYITTDEKGVQIPGFLKLLSEKLQLEHDGLFGELDELDKNIDHIKNVIRTQQSYAGSYGLIESVQLRDLIEDALKINLEKMEQKSIQVVRKFDDMPDVHMDKHKVLQIIINLISNAKHALLDTDKNEKVLTLSLYEMNDEVVVEVSDTGIGINTDDLPHLFEYGFRKRKGGHGFGLHNSALVANELGGKIQVESDGIGQGACFKLIVPMQ
jgi:signal transduction histidine kinase